MLNTIFNDYREDKKKGKEYNQRRKEAFTKSREKLKHDHGDIFTLLKTYSLFKEKKSEYKLIKEEREAKLKVEIEQNKDDAEQKTKKSIIEYIKEDNKQSIRKESNQKIEKSIKLLKSLKVSDNIIKSFKKSKKSKQEGGSKSKSVSKNKRNKHQKVV